MTITQALTTLQDPRASNRRHLLSDIVFIAICAVLAGADDWEYVEAWAGRKRDWLSRFLALPHGIPSHDTFSRVFAALDGKSLRDNFSLWMEANKPKTPSRVVNIDGKTLRRSFNDGNTDSAIHMVSAWATDNRLVLGQVKTEAKSNEITAIPDLLEKLTLASCVVTIDAMGCQTEIAESIRAQSADYVLCLKSNQPKMHKAAKARLETVIDATPEGHCQTRDNKHGRVEIRRYWLMLATEDLPRFDKWCDLSCIGVVESECYIKNKLTRQRRYYLTSLANNAEAFAEAVRKHWGIETGLHWVLDVAFREDDCRIRKDNGAENMAVLRHIALNLLRKDDTVKLGIRNKRKLVGADDSYLEKLSGLAC